MGVLSQAWLALLGVLCCAGIGLVIALLVTHAALTRQRAEVEGYLQRLANAMAEDVAAALIRPLGLTEAVVDVAQDSKVVIRRFNRLLTREPPGLVSRAAIIDRDGVLTPLIGSRSPTDIDPVMIAAVRATGQVVWDLRADEALVNLVVPLAGGWVLTVETEVARLLPLSVKRSVGSEVTAVLVDPSGDRIATLVGASDKGNIVLAAARR
ncbi:MAG: hypothetical protein EAZ99_04560, partial [Alphaproteobacteria bacterium]